MQVVSARFLHYFSLSIRCDKSHQARPTLTGILKVEESSLRGFKQGVMFRMSVLEGTRDMVAFAVGLDINCWMLSEQQPDSAGAGSLWAVKDERTWSQGWP